MKNEDILKEIGNIGSGKAAKALSEFSGKLITHKKPKVVVIKKSMDYLKLFESNSEILASIVEFSGDLNGTACLIFPTYDAFTLIGLISKQTKVDIKEYIKEYWNTYSEISNIVIGAYLSAVSDFSDIGILQEVPHSIFGPVTQVIRIFTKLLGSKMNSGICIQTQLNIQNEQIKGFFILSLDQANIEKLLKKAEQKAK
jgi:chemotaxis protein CheC